MIAFPQTSPERFEAYKLLASYLVDSDFQSAWTNAAGLLPVSQPQFSSWNDSELSGILLKVMENAQPLPSTEGTGQIAPLMVQATIDLLQNKVSYIDATNMILNTLSE